MAHSPKRNTLISYLQWRSAPPRSSAETSSPVAALTCKHKGTETLKQTETTDTISPLSSFCYLCVTIYCTDWMRLPQQNYTPSVNYLIYDVILVYVPPIHQQDYEPIWCSNYHPTVIRFNYKDLTNQWRSSQEDGSLLPHNDALICHGRYIRSSSSAGAHHNGNLQESWKRISLRASKSPDIKWMADFYECDSTR